MFKTRSKVVFVSLVLGVAYLIYIASYFFGLSASTEGSEQVGAVLATALVAPHMFILLLAVIFNLISFLGTKKWACITALVLYCVSALVFLAYALFLLPMIILSAVGISKTKQANALKLEAQ